METTTLDHGLDGSELSNQSCDDLVIGNSSSESEPSYYPLSSEIGRWLQAAAMCSILAGPITESTHIEKFFHLYQPSAMLDVNSSGETVPKVITLQIEEQSSEFIPRTSLAKRLWELRQKIIASGRPLLDWDDLENELRERRGERSSGEDS
jgi:hypothetical protein